MDVGQVPTVCRGKVLLAAVVFLRLLQDLAQPLRHPGVLTFKGRVLSIEGGVRVVALRVHQDYFNGHHVSKVLPICGRHIEDTPGGEG